LVDSLPHISDFTGKLVLIEHPVRNVSIEGIERAEAIAWIGAAQVLLHFPDHATPGHQKGVVDLMNEIDAPSRGIAEYAARSSRARRAT